MWIPLCAIAYTITNFMHFAGIAAKETALLEAIQQDILANRALDLHLPF